jgi:hypothetical protein
VAEGRVRGLPANPLIVIGKWYYAFPLMRLPSGPPCVATPARRHVKPHRFPQNPAIPTCFQVSWTPRVTANLAQFWHSSATVLVRYRSGGSPLCYFGTHPPSSFGLSISNRSIVPTKGCSLKRASLGGCRSYLVMALSKTAGSRPSRSASVSACRHFRASTCGSSRCGQAGWRNRRCGPCRNDATRRTPPAFQEL